MKAEDRKTVRDMVDNQGWHRVGIIDEPVSPLCWGKEVEIIYEDMDGNARKCNAIYNHESFSADYFRATDGMAQGNRMANVVACRRLAEVSE